MAERSHGPSVTKSVVDDGNGFTCSNCGAAKPDVTTWPQDCPKCGERIWRTTVSFTRAEVEAVS